MLKSSLNGGSISTAYSCPSCSPYNPFAWTTIENPVSNSSSIAVREPLLREPVCLWLLPRNGSTHYTAPSLQAYHPFFFSEGHACDACDQCHLSPLWLSSPGDYTLTAPPVSSLRLIPSGSMIRCELVQVYHHQPWSRVPPDPVYYIIYPSYYLVQALPLILELGWLPLCMDWATEPHSVVLVVACAVGQSVRQLWQILARIPRHPGSLFLAVIRGGKVLVPEAVLQGIKCFFIGRSYWKSCVACWWPGLARWWWSMWISPGASSSCVLLWSQTGSGTQPMT
jgi:hypothetical protein